MRRATSHAAPLGALALAVAAVHGTAVVHSYAWADDYPLLVKGIQAPSDLLDFQTRKARPLFGLLQALS